MSAKDKDLALLTYKQAALDFVNFIRVEKQGRKPLKRLPKGSRASQGYCPVARALSYTHKDYGWPCLSRASAIHGGFSAYISAHVKGDQSAGVIFQGDSSVAAFLYYFDFWHYPELVK